MRNRVFVCVVCLALSLAGLSYTATAAPQSKPVNQNSAGANATPGQVTGTRTTSSEAPESTDAPLPADAATRNQVLTLLDTMEVRRNLLLMMGNMKQIMKQTVEESFKEKNPDATPKQLEALRGMIDDILDGISQDEMIDAVVQVYQRHLTKTDIEEMIRFYSSPVGQKLLHEQPKMMQESMQAGAELQRKRMDEVMAKIKERAQDLMDRGNAGAKKP